MADMLMYRYYVRQDKLIETGMNLVRTVSRSILENLEGKGKFSLANRRPFFAKRIVNNFRYDTVRVCSGLGLKVNCHKVAFRYSDARNQY